MFNCTWHLHQVSLLDGGVFPWPLPIHTKHGDLSWSGDDEGDVGDGGGDDGGSGGDCEDRFGLKKKSIANLKSSAPALNLAL